MPFFLPSTPPADAYPVPSRYRAMTSLSMLLMVPSVHSGHVARGSDDESMAALPFFLCPAFSFSADATCFAANLTGP